MNAPHAGQDYQVQPSGVCVASGLTLYLLSIKANYTKHVSDNIPRAFFLIAHSCKTTGVTCRAIPTVWWILD